MSKTFKAQLKQLKGDSSDRIYYAEYEGDMPYMAVHRDRLIEIYSENIEELDERELNFLREILSTPEVDYWLVYWD